MSTTTAHTCHGARFLGAPPAVATAECPACTPLTCEADIAYTDFDGSSASHTCGQRATHRVTINDPRAAAFVAGAYGTWEAYRADTIAHALAFDYDAEDPGEDPGRGNWGRSTYLACDAHRADFTADVTVLADEEV